MQLNPLYVIQKNEGLPRNTSLMSRIKPVLKSTSIKDDLNIADNLEEPPFYVVVTWGVFMVLIILTIQYFVLRCSNAVKKENISKVLSYGTLFTLFLSLLTLVLFGFTDGFMDIIHMVENLDLTDSEGKCRQY
jgi:Na+/proline symporter